MNQPDGGVSICRRSPLESKDPRPAKDDTLMGESRKGPRDRPRQRNRVRTGRTRVGKGVFAQRWYRTGQIIGEIRGVVIHDQSYSSEHCMDLGDGGCLEPDPPFRYLNHSCEPNCSFRWHDLRDDRQPRPRRRVFLYASQVIRPGEELTIDYAWPAAAAIPCRCGTPSCRGWIVAKDELAAAEGTEQPF
jgi:hypothetical protein